MIERLELILRKKIIHAILDYYQFQKQTLIEHEFENIDKPYVSYLNNNVNNNIHLHKSENVVRCSGFP